MKKLLALLLSLILLAGCAPDAGPAITAAGTTAAPEVKATVPGTVKAMWLSQFDLTQVYSQGGHQRSREDFTARMAQVLKNVKALGFDTVFLQVRPNADSMYPSEFYPMSAYVTGSLGKEAAYDPVEIAVALAREQGLSIHAWINPMRAMKEAEITRVSEKYPMRRWYEDETLRGKYIVAVNGQWYLNPAYPEVADLIVNGARELMARYGFDGLHMDDYFYPTTDPSFDEAAFKAYRADGGKKDLAAFRRDVLNALVARLYQAAGNRLFGISPSGVIKTVYEKQYADVYTWCAQPGYIDYILPQVYFGLEHQTCDFVSVCRTYSGIIKTDAVALLIGMSFGKALAKEDKWAGTGKTEWAEHTDILARSLQTTRELPHCRGISVFCYQYFHDPLTGIPVAGTAQERENFLPVLRGITWG